MAATIIRPPFSVRRASLRSRDFQGCLATWLDSVVSFQPVHGKWLASSCPLRRRSRRWTSRAETLRCSRKAYFLLASSIFFVYLAGSFLKSLRQSLQQSLISWFPLVNTYGLPMLSSFSPETMHVLRGYGLTSFG